MLIAILVALAVVFLGGIWLIVDSTDFASSDIVAILSPALGAISTVAAGVFGFSIGSRGSSQAQEPATRETAIVHQHMGQIAAKASAASRNVSRIVETALSGDATPDGKRILSTDDLKTMQNLAAEAASGSAPPGDDTEVLRTVSDL
jgi:hypothetical protein